MVISQKRKINQIYIGILPVIGYYSNNKRKYQLKAKQKQAQQEQLKPVGGIGSQKSEITIKEEGQYKKVY